LNPDGILARAWRASYGTPYAAREPFPHLRWCPEWSNVARKMELAAIYFVSNGVLNGMMDGIFAATR